MLVHDFVAAIVAVVLKLHTNHTIHFEQSAAVAQREKHTSRLGQLCAPLNISTIPRGAGLASIQSKETHTVHAGRHKLHKSLRQTALITVAT